MKKVVCGIAIVCGFFVVGCATTGKIVETSSSHSQLHTKFASPAPSPKGQWREEYNAFIVEGIERFGEELLNLDQLPKEELNLLCPGFYQANPSQKKAFWALIFASIAYFESGFDPFAVYHEPPPLIEDSYGLLQLSYVDKNQYPECELDRASKNIFDPRVNLQCGVIIMKFQLRRLKKIFPEWQRGIYWSVLSRKQEKVQAYFLRHASQLGFCNLCP